MITWAEYQITRRAAQAGAHKIAKLTEKTYQKPESLWQQGGRLSKGLRRSSKVQFIGMKIKQLDIDAGPICESGGGRIVAKGSVVSQPGVALKLAVRAQNQEFIKC